MRNEGKRKKRKVRLTPSVDATGAAAKAFAHDDLWSVPQKLHFWAGVPPYCGNTFPLGIVCASSAWCLLTPPGAAHSPLILLSTLQVFRRALLGTLTSSLSHRKVSSHSSVWIHSTSCKHILQVSFQITIHCNRRGV